MDKLKGKRVLICDDSEINREMLAMILEDREILSEEARNGQEAVEKWSNSIPGTYDAILMDLMMPVMDGTFAMRRIRMAARRDAEKVFIVALSGSEYRNDMEKAYAAGADMYLLKPVNPEELYEALEKNL